MNSKGQALVVFVILLPIFVLIFSFIADIGMMTYEKQRLNANNKIAITYYMYHIEANKDQITSLILKNDKDIKIKNIDISDNNIKISLTKTYKTKFNKVIGIKEYQLSSNYNGYIKEKKIIKE